MTDSNSSDRPNLDFIREIAAEDVRTGKNGGQVITRFPPRAERISAYRPCQEHLPELRDCPGVWRADPHLPTDDTNPVKEEVEYIDSIKHDVKWLGFDWGRHMYYASDYFGRILEWAILLIKAGKAYVDDLSAEELPRRAAR